MKDKVIFLVGPTAVGKTDIAVKLTKRINAEIISCDSMQIYRGMGIISSSPAKAILRKVRHHLLAIKSPTSNYNVADYCKAANKKIKEIIKKGKTPLFVGGTGLYMSILLDGIFEDKDKDKDKIRERLYKEAERFGREKLHKRLERVDPVAASKIHPNDLRRVVRALEVYEKTKTPISQLQKKRNGIAQECDVKVIGLNMDRNELYSRIDKRVDRMFRLGLIKEVKRLLKLKLSRTASQAIGIKELRGFFCKEYDLDEAKRLMKRNSRHYAKRQLTWFRRDKRIDWVYIGKDDRPVEIADKIRMR